MKQCIHGTKAYCHICWRKPDKWDDEPKCLCCGGGLGYCHTEESRKYGEFATKQAFDNDKISCGTTYD